MRRIARYICMLLVFVMLVAMPARATDGISSRASNYFLTSNVYLYETSGTNFQAWFHVTGVRTMEKIGASEIKIQRSSDNTNWSTMRTYSMSDVSSMICANTATHTSHISYTGTKGYYYRAYIKLYAKDSSGSATWSVYTSSIYLD